MSAVLLETIWAITIPNVPPPTRVYKLEIYSNPALNKATLWGSLPQTVSRSVSVDGGPISMQDLAVNWQSITWSNSLFGKRQLYFCTSSSHLPGTNQFADQGEEVYAYEPGSVPPGGTLPIEPTGIQTLFPSNVGGLAIGSDKKIYIASSEAIVNRDPCNPTLAGPSGLFACYLDASLTPQSKCDGRFLNSGGSNPWQPGSRDNFVGQICVGGAMDEMFGIGEDDNGKFTGFRIPNYLLQAIPVQYPFNAFVNPTPTLNPENLLGLTWGKAGLLANNGSSIQLASWSGGKAAFNNYATEFTPSAPDELGCIAAELPWSHSVPSRCAALWMEIYVLSHPAPHEPPDVDRLNALANWYAIYCDGADPGELPPGRDLKAGENRNEPTE